MQVIQFKDLNPNIKDYFICFSDKINKDIFCQEIINHLKNHQYNPYYIDKIYLIDKALNNGIFICNTNNETFITNKISYEQINKNELFFQLTDTNIPFVSSIRFNNDFVKVKITTKPLKKILSHRNPSNKIDDYDSTSVDIEITHDIENNQNLIDYINNTSILLF